MFVFQSDHKGLPISILEAMASGLIIIAATIGGISDAVKQEENGLLRTSYDKDQLVGAINWIINN